MAAPANQQYQPDVITSSRRTLEARGEPRHDADHDGLITTTACTFSRYGPGPRRAPRPTHSRSRWPLDRTRHNFVSFSLQEGSGFSFDRIVCDLGKSACVDAR